MIEKSRLSGRFFIGDIPQYPAAEAGYIFLDFSRSGCYNETAGLPPLRG